MTMVDRTVDRAERRSVELCDVKWCPRGRTRLVGGRTLCWMHADQAEWTPIGEAQNAIQRSDMNKKAAEAAKSYRKTRKSVKR